MRDHLATLLDDFRRSPSDIAVVRYQGIRRRVTTYGELAQLAGRFAALLRERGIGSGDRVLLWAENSAEWIAAFHGCLLRGVLAVPLDAAGSADFAQRVAADVRPKLAVGDAVLLERLGSVVSHTGSEVSHPSDKNKGVARVGHPGLGFDPSELVGSSIPRSQNRDLGHPGVQAGLDFPTLAFEDWAGVLPDDEAGPVEGLGPDSPLQILFTSGTTGDPKGIVITHGNVLASVGPIESGAQPYLRYARVIHPLRILHTLPLSHVFGQTMGLWIPPIFRAELHFENRLVASRLIETIRRERISVLAAVPRVLALLKAHLEIAFPTLPERIAASQGIKAWKRWWRFRDVHGAFGLKFWALVSGGGSLPGALEQFWNALGLVLVQGYGMTETTALITLNHPFHVARGTIGKPMAGREVKLGQDGEVLVRGASISSATWQGGELHAREDEWLATGDLAETQASGDLRFLGRKSEVIVTSAGLNLHPEDLEAAIEQQAGVVGCAVVAQETASGPEPCAVLAFRGSAEQAAAAMDRANAQLAEFQRVRRWRLWPEPDLPRTSTGKIRRKVVAVWLANSLTGRDGPVQNDAVRGDWLVGLLAQISGETAPGDGDELRLSEDFHLDSLGRVQLSAAIEERLGGGGNGRLEQVQTLGELRRLLRASPARDEAAEPAVESSSLRETTSTPDQREVQVSSAPTASYLYPKWPWWGPVRWLRVTFLELVARPLVWLLADPEVVIEAEGAVVSHPSDKNKDVARVGHPAGPRGAEVSHPFGQKTSNGWGTERCGELGNDGDEPMVIVVNHVSTYDGPLVQYALPGWIRRRMAAAMSGEMLEEFRHFRNPETGRFFVFGPAAYLALTMLFNVFPLPRLKNFQQSFAHAGEALDRGYNVLVFPEGTRSAAGELARFRPGIGLLVKQAGAAVLPVAIRGLGELKTRQRGWFRSGTVEVRVGRPIRFSPLETEAGITARLHAEVERLLKG